ncbi:oligoendopeptidase F, partial [bacterium]|nr:oligoendopeptidase F [bacterium]
AAAALVAFPAVAPAAGAARDRADIEDRYKWNLADIYEDDAAWEADFAKAEKMAEEMAGLQETHSGKLAGSGKAILELQHRSEEMEGLIDRLYLYAGLKGDQDTRVSEYQGFVQRLQRLGTEVGASMSWVEPELLAIPRKKLQGYLDNTKGLKIYQHQFDDMWRQQEHVLSEKEEKILSLAGELAGGPSAVYGQMMNADLSFGSFLDENGEEVEMTRARYGKYMKNPNRDVRERAWNVYYDGYERYLHGATASYAASVKKDIFYTKARGYESCSQRALDADNVPVEVLDNLIATINDNFDAVRRYNLIRKRMLGVDTLRHWDSYVSLTPDMDEEITYDEATKIILAGLKPLGEDYVNDLHTALTSRWIDVYENEGKRSGAYSWGSFSAPHPYMLLNYENRLDDVFTLAHEGGHTMHTYYTTATQPQVYADYSLFVAEVASTTNEAILIDDMLRNTTDRDRRIFLLNHSINEILGTVYTQVMFSEFEKTAHEMAESGTPLTVDSLNELYGGLINKYGGGVVEYTDRSATGWSRIPHFYRPFYVYKYATSYAAALALAEGILDERPGALDAYRAFLRSGSSDYPIELLKGAGVDLSEPAPIQAACDRLSAMVDELDELLSGT